MYAILISAALAIYSLILIDFNNLHQQIALGGDLLGSTQALYTAEGAVEKTVTTIGRHPSSLANLKFLSEKSNEDRQKNDEFIQYNQGTNAAYNNRDLKLTGPFLHVESSNETKNSLNKTSRQPFEERVLSQSAYYGIEARNSKSFIIKEIETDYNFNEIQFEFNQGEENSEILIEVFALPREGDELKFPDFETLKNNPGAGSVKRLSINTKDHSFNGSVFDAGVPFVVDIRNQGSPFKQIVHISGFQPLDNNYIFQFQTLDNKAIHYKLSAWNQGRNVVLPGLMQTFDLIGAAPGGIYQRIKYQRQAEEGTSSGINFAHFSDDSIDK